MSAEYLGTGGTDGSVLGRDGGKVGFYGATPIAKPTANLATTATATTTALETSINSCLLALKNLGLITSNAA